VLLLQPYQPSPNLLTAQITDYTSAMQYYNNPATDFTQSALPAVHVDNKYQNIAEYDQSLHLNCSVYHTPFRFSRYNFVTPFNLIIFYHFIHSYI